MATKRVLKIAGTSLLVILSGAVLYLFFADFGRFRPQIESLVTEATGRELRIGGDLRIRALPRPSLVATDITFANASWGSPMPMASVGRLAIEVGLWSLLSGPIRVKSLEVQDVAVLLEQNASGEANWTFGSQPQPPQENTDAGWDTLPVIVERSSIGNVDVVLRRPEREDLQVALDTLALTNDDGNRTAEASGSAADVPFTLRGTLAPDGDGARIGIDATAADAMLHGEADVRPRRIDFKLSTADLSRAAALLLADPEGIPAAPLDLAGTLLLATDHYELRDTTAKLLMAESHLAATIPRGSDGPIEIDLSVTAPDVSELRAGFPALRLAANGKAKIAADRIDVDPVSVELGDSDFSGSGSAVLGDVMAVTIKGQSKLIDLTQLQPAAAEDAKPARKPAASASAPATSAASGGKAKEWVFAEDELPLEQLRALDITVELAAAEVRSDSGRAQNVGLALNGKGGIYDAKTSFAVADGGDAQGHVVFDAAGDTAKVDLDFAATGLLLNLVSGEVEDPSQIPLVGLSAKVRSTGNSPRALASVANGRVTFTQGPGRIDNAALGLVSGDIFAQVFSALNPFAKDDKHSNWDCTVVAVDVIDGLGEIVPMLSQGEKLLITGHGKLDLKTEKIDVEFNTKPRSGVGVTADMFVTPFVKLGGTLADPGVSMNAKGTLLAAGAAALTGGLSVLVQGIADRATGEADQCADALAKLDPPATSAAAD